MAVKTNPANIIIIPKVLPKYIFSLRNMAPIINDMGIPICLNATTQETFVAQLYEKRINVQAAQVNIDIRNIVFQLILTFLKSTLNVILSINKNGISIIAIEQYKKGK